MAAKASSMQELNELHRLVTQSYSQRIKQDLDDEIPTDAATLSGAVKFLKDNAVTADPADQDDLAELRERLKASAGKRKKTVGNVVALAAADVDNVLEA